MYVCIYTDKFVTNFDMNLYKGFFKLINSWALVVQNDQKKQVTLSQIMPHFHNFWLTFDVVSSRRCARLLLRWTNVWPARKNASKKSRICGNNNHVFFVFYYCVERTFDQRGRTHRKRVAPAVIIIMCFFVFYYCDERTFDQRGRTHRKRVAPAVIIVMCNLAYLVRLCLSVERFCVLMYI